MLHLIVHPSSVISILHCLAILDDFTFNTGSSVFLRRKNSRIHFTTQEKQNAFTIFNQFIVSLNPLFLFGTVFKMPKVNPLISPTFTRFRLHHLTPPAPLPSAKMDPRKRILKSIPWLIFQCSKNSKNIDSRKVELKI